MRQAPEIASRALPLTVTLAVVWPLSLWVPDYRIMLVVIMIQYALTLLVSHALSERPFRLSLNRAAIGAALHFGWPLLVNNLLLFLVFNGEKLIVGRELGMEALGLLAMGFTLTLTPTLVLARSAQSFFLPQLSALQDSPERFDAIAVVAFQAVVAATLIFLGFVVFLGGPFVMLIFGEKYAALVPLMAWLGILQSLRFLKAGSSILALAKGHTSNAMWANMIRLLALPAAWMAAMNDAGLLIIIWIGIVGEFFGFLVSLGLLRGSTQVALRPLRPVFVTFTMTMGMTVLNTAISASASEHHWLIMVALWMGCAVGCLSTMSALRSYLQNRTLIQFET